VFINLIDSRDLTARNYHSEIDEVISGMFVE